MTEQVGMSSVDQDSAGEFLLHYQLQHDPFAARPKGFRFFTPGRKPVLAQLHHMAHFSDQVQVVVGPSGSGKTLLRQALVASCNKEKVQCIVTSGREQAEAAGLERLICQTLGVDDMTMLLERTEQLHATGLQLYLVVDDAHCLDQAAVQLLAELSQSGQSAPHVFLFAEESIVDLLEAVEMSDDRAWLQLVELAPFTLDETRGYLAQRLEGAGQGIELLDEQQIARIHELGRGWPGLINQEAHRLMMAELDEPARPVRKQRPGVPLRSLVALVLVGAGVAIAWMMGGEDPAPERTVLSLPDQVPGLDVTDVARGGPVLQMPNERAATLELIAEEPDTEQAGLAEVVRQPRLPVTADTQTALPAPVALPELPPAEVAPLVAAPAPVAAEVAPDRTASPAPAPTPTPTPAAVAQTPAPRTPEPVAAPAAPPPVASQPAASAYHEDGWYRQRPATEYALQLLGTRSRQAALDFMKAQAGLTELGYFETEHEGRPWFVVTQGAYANRTQAQQAVARLPEALRKQQPWPRSMGSIQQSLR